MAAQPVYTPLSELNGDRDDWVICVKVHHIWHQSYKNSPTQIASKEMILVDQQGNKIHGSIKKNLLSEFSDSVNEGNFLEISNFGVGKYYGKYLMVDHHSKVNFYRATKVRRVPPFEESTDGFTLVPYDDINMNRHNVDVAFDVVGQVISIGDMRILLDNGKQSKMLTCVLRDIDGKTLNCALWGEFAAQLNTYIENNQVSTNPIIMLIQLAKMKQWAGNLQVSNSLFGTKLYINDDVNPIIAYKNRLLPHEDGASPTAPPTVLSSRTIIQTEADYYKKFYLKTIDEVREIKKTTGCVVIGTILKVLLEDGWFYYHCNQCGKTVDKKHDDCHEVDTFSCYECGPVNEVTPKVRTVIRVQDETGATSFSMFGNVVAKYLKRTEQWLNLKMKNGGNPNVLPVEYEEMLNKQCLFKIQIGQFNIDMNCAGYTVHRFTDDEALIREVLDFAQKTDPLGVVNDDDFVTPTNKIIGSKIGDSLSPIPLTCINLEGSSQKRKSESPIEDLLVESSTSKKSMNMEALKDPRIENN